MRDSGSESAARAGFDMQAIGAKHTPQEKRSENIPVAKKRPLIVLINNLRYDGATDEPVHLHLLLPDMAPGAEDGGIPGYEKRRLDIKLQRNKAEFAMVDEPRHRSTNRGGGTL
ncbi:hypothetical protein GQX73_g8433 [Xylaria multiplex]|uniref:Uncharacterized protein n=1 Tax=Xylaria multiplex TaxID=323545 RepID=A0A7C8IJI2_9PEZI|nr:hypothetical protein GQX73_g8433 [Xylaria multiplex]